MDESAEERMVREARELREAGRACRSCEGYGYNDIDDPETGGVIGPAPCQRCGATGVEPGL